MKVFVLKQDLAIGFLEENKTNEVRFEYFANIQRDKYLSGLNERINNSDDGLFTIFYNFLPENEQLKLLKNKYKINNSIEILLYLKKYTR